VVTVVSVIALTAAAAMASAPIGRDPAPGSDCGIDVRTPYALKYTESALSTGIDWNRPRRF
jgi:hypothetical protein